MIQRVIPDKYLLVKTHKIYTHTISSSYHRSIITIDIYAYKQKKYTENIQYYISI